MEESLSFSEVQTVISSKELNKKFVVKSPRNSE